MLDSGSPLAVGQLVPDYELLRRIGAGAYGEVWLARSNATGALRAAKIVRRSRFEDERPYQREFEGIQRFERVSREHQSQLALLHIGRNDTEGYFYYVMELADPIPVLDDARSLTSSLSNGAEEGPERSKLPDVGSYNPHTLRADLAQGRLPSARVLEIGLALSEALAHLHDNGLVHRDVKPSNVIFVHGRPKLADIGLVTDASDQCSIVGTEGYLPLEGPGTPQADIFALGKVLYEAATGLDRREFPKLPEALRDWPDARLVAEINEIVLRACARDTVSRYKSAQEVLDDLARLGHGKSVRQKRALRQRWAVAKKVLIAAAVVGVLAMGGLILWRQSRVTRPLSENPEAVKHYQQAVYQLQSGTLDRHLEAYTNLMEAVRLDPGFLDAHYMMIEANFSGDNLPPYYNMLTNSRVVVAKLRELNPNSAQYHTANSWVKFLEWKFEEAIQEAALAIKLNPRFVRAHGVYAGEVLQAHGDVETARRELQIAERLDPSDVVIQFVEAEPFLMERKFDLAIQQLNKAHDLEPRINVHYHLAQAYEATGQYEKALDEHESNALAMGLDPQVSTNWYNRLRSELKTNGARGWWQAQVGGDWNSPSFNPWWTARYCARLGRTNEVFSLLNWAYTNHDFELTTLLIDDCWDPLRGDPRFKEFVSRMGFHPKSAP